LASAATFPGFDEGPGKLNVLLGNGDGSFQPPRTYAAGFGPHNQYKFVTVGDFNGDGHLDLVMDNRSGTVSILLGNGDGTFGEERTYSVSVFGDSSPTSSVAVGDFNGDGHLDVAVACVSAVSILLGNGDGTFQAAKLYAAGTASVAVAA